MDKFWLNDLTTLFDRNNLFQIIPYSNLNLNQKLNSIFRLSIYFSIIMFIFKRDYRYLMIILIVGVLTMIVYKNMHKSNVEANLSQDLGFNNDSINDSNINDDSKGCILPTKNNPFMNPIFSNIEKGDLRKACNSYDNPLIRDMENDYFNIGLYRDITDVFNNNNSQREYYTMPVNSIVNDAVKFAEWCYKTPPTCKEGNGLQCFTESSHN